MKKELTYNEAFDKLEEILEQLEEGDIPLDKLSTKVKQANEFIAICETKLRNIQNEIKEVTKTTTTQTRKKK
jgi:exodeoxyribonuclease VII small subunit